MKSSEAKEILVHNINWLRKYCGVSREEMAKILEIKTENVDEIEKGIFCPKIRIRAVFNMEDRFEMPAELLLGHKL